MTVHCKETSAFIRAPQRLEWKKKIKKALMGKQSFFRLFWRRDKNKLDGGY
jgi:hypothetical protein